MDFLSLLGHLAVFMAPAFGVGLLLWLMLPVAREEKNARRWGRGLELVSLWGLGVLMLGMGFLFFGQDGKMTSYGVLVLAQGTLAWWLRGG